MKSGLYITDDILKIEDLTFIEKGILALYMSYTKFGKMKCCKLTKEQIAVELGICEKTVQRTRKKLEEFGYIRTNGGNTVWYVGDKKTNVPPKDKMSPQRRTNCPANRTKCPSKEDKMSPIIYNKNIIYSNINKNLPDYLDDKDWLDKINFDEL